MELQELNLKMKKRGSQPFRPRAYTERKSINTPGNIDKRKVARAGSFKDAPITKYIYNQDAKSEENNSGSATKSDQLIQPQITLLKKKTTCEVGDNPFLKLRKSFAQKEKQKELKKISMKPKTFQNESLVLQKVVTLRQVRDEFDKNFVVHCKLGMI